MPRAILRGRDADGMDEPAGVHGNDGISLRGLFSDAQP